MSKKFWFWIYKKSKAAIKQMMLSEQGVDIKCPNCQQWFSITSVEHEHELESTEFGFRAVCGSCGAVSYWNSEIAPFPVNCSHDGKPVKAG